jgi:hypothetical protein
MHHGTAQLPRGNKGELGRAVECGQSVAASLETIVQVDRQQVLGGDVRTLQLLAVGQVEQLQPRAGLRDGGAVPRGGAGSGAPGRGERSGASARPAPALAPRRRPAPCISASRLAGARRTRTGSPSCACTRTHTARSAAGTPSASCGAASTTTYAARATTRIAATARATGGSRTGAACGAQGTREATLAEPPMTSSHTRSNQALRAQGSTAPVLKANGNQQAPTTSTRPSARLARVPTPSRANRGCGGRHNRWPARSAPHNCNRIAQA